MANAYITEHTGKGDEARGRDVEAVKWPYVAAQKVAFTTTTQSAAFNNNAYIIRIISDAACHFDVGSNPTATTSDPLLPANVIEYLVIHPGDKIAFVTTA